MRSTAKSIEGYLSELPVERKKSLRAVRKIILDNLPDGYEEAMNWGMITYQVPLSIYPDTYNKQPLMYAALASQKNHMAVYLIGIYMDRLMMSDFKSKYIATGKRYDVGKSCVRFRTLEDLPLSLIGEAISKYSVDDFINKWKQLRFIKKKNNT
ncbi:DUF1801 domain-containing protein [Chloroflexota bacterium]